MSSQLSEDTTLEEELALPILSCGDCTGAENDETDVGDDGFLSVKIGSTSTILFIRDWATIVFMVLVSHSWTRKFTRPSASVMSSDTWSNERRHNIDGGYLMENAHIWLPLTRWEVSENESEHNNSFVHRIMKPLNHHRWLPYISINMIFTHNWDENTPSLSHYEVSLHQALRPAVNAFNR